MTLRYFIVILLIALSATRALADQGHSTAVSVESRVSESDLIVIGIPTGLAAHKAFREPDVMAFQVLETLKGPKFQTVTVANWGSDFPDFNTEVELQLESLKNEKFLLFLTTNQKRRLGAHPANFTPPSEQTAPWAPLYDGADDDVWKPILRLSKIPFPPSRNFHAGGPLNTAGRTITSRDELISLVKTSVDWDRAHPDAPTAVVSINLKDWKSITPFEFAGEGIFPRDARTEGMLQRWLSTTPEAKCEALEVLRAFPTEENKRLIASMVQDHDISPVGTDPDKWSQWNHPVRIIADDVLNQWHVEHPKPERATILPYQDVSLTWLLVIPILVLVLAFLRSTNKGFSLRVTGVVFAVPILLLFLALQFHASSNYDEFTLTAFSSRVEFAVYGNRFRLLNSFSATNAAMTQLSLPCKFLPMRQPTWSWDPLYMAMYVNADNSGTDPAAVGAAQFGNATRYSSVILPYQSLYALPGALALPWLFSSIFRKLFARKRAKVVACCRLCSAELAPDAAGQLCSQCANPAFA